MQRLVAVICEYNPFHLGHLYQIEQIKKELPDAKIIGIMSGNTVQRGEFALFEKYDRARLGVMAGLNGVFELPFPYSCSCAEVFAQSAVSLAVSLGAEFLSFGVEGDFEKLQKIAQIQCSDEYEEELKKQLQDKTISYATAKEKALKKWDDVSLQPNDILAVEYQKAILQNRYSLKPLAIERKRDFLPAHTIRKEFEKSQKAVSVPEVFSKEYEKISYLDSQKAQRFLYWNVLQTNPSKIETVADVSCGTGYYLHELAKKETPGDFFEKLANKTLTQSRAKRLIINTAFGVFKISKKPRFTTFLAGDEIGCKIAKEGRKKGLFVLSGVAETQNCPATVQKQIEKSREVDGIYQTLLHDAHTPYESYQKTPYIKKSPK